MARILRRLEVLASMTYTEADGDRFKRYPCFLPTRRGEVEGSFSSTILKRFILAVSLKDGLR